MSVPLAPDQGMGIGSGRQHLHLLLPWFLWYGPGPKGSPNNKEILTVNSGNNFSLKISSLLMFAFKDKEM